MDISSIICKFLGLQDLILENIEYFDDEKQIYSQLTVKLPIHLARCADCGGEFFEVHQWHKRTIKAPPLGIYQKIDLTIKFPRGHCSLCHKIKPARLSSLHPKFKNLSCSFVELAGRMMEDATCAATSRWFRSSPSLMWKVDQWRMKHLKSNDYQLPEGINVSELSADEVHFLTYKNKNRVSPFSKKWTPEFITNLVCTRHSKIISNAPGRDSKALRTCLKSLTKKQLSQVKYFALDMNPGFFSTAKKKCPNAEICVDRFHLIQMMNKSVDKVRSQEYRKAQRKKDSFQMTMLGPKRRYLIMENRNNTSTSVEEDNMLGKLKTLNDNIHNAILITDYFHSILEHKGIKFIIIRVPNRQREVRESKSKIFKKFALKIRKYRKNIEAYIYSRLTTARSEGLNNKIKVLKRAGYAYTNKKSYQNKILQRCGYLNSQWINTNYLFWHITTPQV